MDDAAKQRIVTAIQSSIPKEQVKPEKITVEMLTEDGIDLMELLRQNSSNGQ